MCRLILIFSFWTQSPKASWSEGCFPILAGRKWRASQSSRLSCGMSQSYKRAKGKAEANESVDRKEGMGECKCGEGNVGEKLRCWTPNWDSLSLYEGWGTSNSLKLSFFLICRCYEDNFFEIFLSNLVHLFCFVFVMLWQLSIWRAQPTIFGVFDCGD